MLLDSARLAFIANVICGPQPSRYSETDLYFPINLLFVIFNSMTIINPLNYKAAL